MDNLQPTSSSSCIAVLTLKISAIDCATQGNENNVVSERRSLRRTCFSSAGSAVKAQLLKGGLCGLEGVHQLWDKRCQTGIKLVEV